MEKLTADEVLKKLKTVPLSAWKRAWHDKGDQRLIFEYRVLIGKYNVVLYPPYINLDIQIFRYTNREAVKRFSGGYGLYSRIEQYFEKKDKILSEKQSREIDRIMAKQELALKKAFTI